ncbi:UDP-N-acetylenolpyruvoylglucosamine reductase [Nitritalea halalkaliphila LW7]|uniref:UDP-N-acetylenolpyruvoylglucosamine reductase n=2 Tax=Nitritalea TaxID=1187887 RepID=I5C6V9_9BACT|nr:UDP-N-acetylenolpyruvoylglucosamine reductase [Nitritalea halalkaliphila LW7]
MQTDISLKTLTTFGIAQQARYYTAVSNLSELLEALDFARQRQMPYFLLGGGSNILFTRDFPGLIIHMAIGGIQAQPEAEGQVLVRAGAGENWHQFVCWCLERGYYGLENLSLIPGTVGASPMQNIGAYGVEVKDHFAYLEALEVHTGEVHRFDAEACAFGYRESVFKKALKGRYIILEVAFQLHTQPKLRMDYGDIAATVEQLAAGAPPSPELVAQAVIQIRQSKLPDPAQIGNAGSFFKNPIVPEEQYHRLALRHPNMPHYPAAGGIKIPAGWLIEQAGFKGLTKGQVGVHARQALVLVNYGDARGEEVLALSEEIMQVVQERFGILLEREVNIL